MSNLTFAGEVVPATHLKISVISPIDGDAHLIEMAGTRPCGSDLVTSLYEFQYMPLQ